MTRRPRILVLNQYYRPGVEATANLLGDLCEALAASYDMTVVTGRLHDRPGLPDEEILNGVRVLRTRSTAFDRTQLHRRAANYVTYLGDSVIRGLSVDRPDLVVCMTDPPIVGAFAVGVARRHGAPLLVISQDVFPEIATELGRLTNPALVGTLRALVRFYLRRADHIVAIGERMRERLIAKGAQPEQVTTIPNWVDTKAIVPASHSTEWSRQHGFADRFVVMHSGNVGHAHNLDNLVLATTYMRDLDDLVVPIVGFGARHFEVAALIERLDAVKVRMLPYQQRDLLSQSLSSAHLHYLGLAKGLAGFVVPSRLYGILAAGRPVLAAADADSETARLVSEVGCGLVVPPDRPDLIAAAIREAHDGKHDLDEMGRRGREYAERHADRSVAIGRYEELVAELVATRRSGAGMPRSSSNER